MKITILNTSENHPINAWLDKWMNSVRQYHDVVLKRSKSELDSGDLLFLISCHEIITEFDRKKFNKTLVIHASDLPLGRGWSPHIWTILGGSTRLTVTLLEAEV